MMGLHEQKTESQGFYVKVNEDWIGIYSSEQGPKLFYNRDIYPLYNGSWDVELLIGKENNLFIFYWNGEVKISFKYSKMHEFFPRVFELLNHKAHGSKSA